MLGFVRLFPLNVSFMRAKILLCLTLLGTAILRLVCGPLRITQTLSREAQDQNYFHNYTEKLVAFLTTSAKSVVGKTLYGLKPPTIQGHQTILVVTVFFTTTHAHGLKTKALSFKNALDEAVLKSINFIKS